VLYVPAMNALFHTVPLDGAALLAVLGMAAVVLVAEEARKAVVRRLRAG
jgi:P-type Ca2+ transporter type 2C